MAFYKDMNDATRKEKQRKAEARGGFEDEGSRYGGRRGSMAQNRGGQGGYGAPRGNAPRGNAPRSEGRYGERDGMAQNRGGQGGYGAPRGNAPRGNTPRSEGRYGERDGAAQNRGGQGGYGAPRGNAPQGNAPRSEGRYGERRDRRPQEGRFQQDARPMSFRDRPRSGTPVGERPPVERSNPKDFKKSGNYRFSTGAPIHYNERGMGQTPTSYDERRRARAQDEPRYQSYRYAGPAAYDAGDDAPEQDLVPNENLLSGRNPIREALKSGRDIEKLLVARGELSGSAREIVQMAKERHIPVQEVDRSRLDDITHNHQGMLAFASAYQYSTLEDMLALADARNEKPFLILLDGVTDPHNLGAIIRTAECAGAHGVIVQERRAVGLTPAAVKASAGAVEHIPVARVTNLGNAIESLKKKNIWIYAADMEGEDYTKIDFDGAVALVIGAEGEGVGRRVLECCDKAVSIPLRGKLESLNASVAAGVLMYAVMRFRP